MHRCVLAAVAAVFVLGCNVESAGGGTGTPLQGSSSSSVGAPGEDASTTSPGFGTGVGTSSSGDPEAIKLDVGDPTAGDDSIPPLPPPLPFPESCEEASEVPSSVGCEFVIAVVPQSDVPSFDTAYMVSNVSDEVAHVVLEDADGVIAERDVPAGSTDTFVVDATHQLRFDTSRSTDGLRLRSDQVLQVFAVSPPVRSWTADASLLLPVGGLGTRHRVGVYPGAEGAMNLGTQYLAVVAAEDDTAVTIRLDGDETVTFGGAGLPALDLLAGMDRLTLTLDALDTLVIAAPSLSTPLNDLSGTLVEASAPIAVHTGTSAQYLPAASANSDRCCADLLTEQVPPTTAWGWRYAGVKFRPLGSESDIWRFIADQDDTTIHLAGGVDKTLSLDAGEAAEVITDENFVIESTRPIGVLHLMTSTSEVSASGYPSGAFTIDTPDCGLVPDPGDPAMTWVYPRGNWLTRYTFTVDISAEAPWCDDHVTVVAATDAWDEIRHNGEPLPAGTPLADGELSFAYVSTPQGVHHFVAPDEVGFEVTAYGIGDFGSYIFAGGVGLRDLSAAG